MSRYNVEITERAIEEAGRKADLEDFYRICRDKKLKGYERDFTAEGVADGFTTLILEEKSKWRVDGLLTVENFVEIKDDAVLVINGILEVGYRW